MPSRVDRGPERVPSLKSVRAAVSPTAGRFPDWSRVNILCSHEGPSLMSLWWTICEQVEGDTNWETCSAVRLDRTSFDWSAMHLVAGSRVLYSIGPWCSQVECVPLLLHKRGEMITEFSLTEIDVDSTQFMTYNMV